MKRVEEYIGKKFKIDASYYIRGTFWTTFSQAVVLIGGLATTVIFAKVLSTADYGTYKYIITAAALFTSFSLSGLGQSILQTAARKYYSFYTETLKLSLFYGAGISAVSIGASLYYIYQHNYLLASGFAIIAVTQPFANTYQNIFAFLLGSKRFKESAKAQVFNVLAMSLLAIAAIFITRNILILIAVYFFSNFITFFLTHLYYRPINVESTPPEISKKFISYAKHTSIRNVISNVAFRLDSMLIFTRLGAAELAIYTIANLLPEQVKGALKNIAVLLLPKYAEHKGTESIKQSIPRRSFQLFFILCLLTAAYIMLIPFVYRLLFPNYESTVFLSQIAALSFPALVYLIPFSALQTQLNENALHSFTLYGSIFQITITLFLIYFFGLMGAVIAKVISRYTGTMIIYYYLFLKKNPI